MLILQYYIIITLEIFMGPNKSDLKILIRIFYLRIYNLNYRVQLENRMLL